MTAGARRRSTRERFREQMREEVKEVASRQLAEGGATAISLNAVAKELGVSGPALYRYYAGRDELLTELILDAYRSLADTLAAATAHAADISHFAHALRGWALESPHRYFLLFGTPVPGYHAPESTTAITREIMAILLACLRPPEDPVATGGEGREPEERPSLDQQQVSVARMRSALTCWTRVHGTLSLELAGHFAGMDVDPAALFEAELTSLLDLPGGSTP